MGSYWNENLNLFPTDQLTLKIHAWVAKHLFWPNLHIRSLTFDLYSVF